MPIDEIKRLNENLEKLTSSLNALFGSRKIDTEKVRRDLMEEQWEKFRRDVDSTKSAKEFVIKPQQAGKAFALPVDKLNNATVVKFFREIDEAMNNARSKKQDTVESNQPHYSGRGKIYASMLKQDTVKKPYTEGSAVNHPKHYNNHPSGVECIEIVRHMNFNCGNVVKYLWRCDEKHEVPIVDLEKAEVYIRDEIERLKNIERVKESNK